jgi:hypothetical protein
MSFFVRMWLADQIGCGANDLALVQRDPGPSSGTEQGHYVNGAEPAGLVVVSGVRHPLGMEPHRQVTAVWGDERTATTILAPDESVIW